MGHPELELFRLIIKIQFLIREQKNDMAIKVIKTKISDYKEWKRDYRFIDNISRWLYDTEAFGITYQLCIRGKKIDPFHFYLASKLETLGKIKKARGLFEKIDESNEIDRNDIKGSTAFHLGRMLMEKEPEKAASYFKKTLSYIPDHGKAREFLDLLTRK